MDKELEKDMTPKLLQDLGMKYSNKKSNRKHRYGLYECQYCGRAWKTIVNNIKSATTKSCGCQKGKGDTPTLHYTEVIANRLSLKVRKNKYRIGNERNTQAKS